MSMAKAQAGIHNRESANFLCKSQIVSILGTASPAAPATHPRHSAVAPQRSQGQCVNE